MATLIESVSEAIVEADTLDDPAAAREAIRAVALHIQVSAVGDSVGARSRRLIAQELYAEARA